MSKYPKKMKPEFGKACRLLSGIPSEIKWVNPAESPICHFCGKAIEAKDSIAIQEIQVNYFRGDDETDYFHQPCWGKHKRGEKCLI